MGRELRRVPPDISGQRFGRLVAISIADPIKGDRAWLCECDCGKQRIVRQASLRNGDTKSCGCLLAEVARTTLRQNKTIGGERYCAEDDPEVRFWCSVRSSRDGCWGWYASVGGKEQRFQYGQISIGGKQFRAHRYSWELHYGAITDGLFVCHKCDNPRCVRPDHLFLGTNSDNMRDCVAKGRHVKAYTYCKRPQR